MKRRPIPDEAILLALTFSLGFAGPAAAGDYAGAISAYRRAHGFCGEADSRLSAVALKQARAMASTGTVSHSAGGNFAARVAPLRKSRGRGKYRRRLPRVRRDAEAVGGLSSGHRENLLMPGARRVGVASVDNPKSPYRKFWAMVITD